MVHFSFMFVSCATLLKQSGEIMLHLLIAAPLTIQVLDVFDIAEGELQLIIGSKVVHWIHDGSRVRWVGKADCMAEFMGGHSKEVETFERKDKPDIWYTGKYGVRICAPDWVSLFFFFKKKKGFSTSSV